MPVFYLAHNPVEQHVRTCIYQRCVSEKVSERHISKDLFHSILRDVPKASARAIYRNSEWFDFRFKKQKLLVFLGAGTSVILIRVGALWLSQK